MKTIKKSAGDVSEMLLEYGLKEGLTSFELAHGMIFLLEMYFDIIRKSIEENDNETD